MKMTNEETERLIETLEQDINQLRAEINMRTRIIEGKRRRIEDLWAMLNPGPMGRKYVDGCSTCETVKANNGFGPSHDANSQCESGKREHCTCDMCF